MPTPDELLKPIAADSPCGPDLTWDPLLAEIRTLIRGKIDRKIEETSSGKRVVETVEEPNWHKVLSQCEAALRKSHHLEVCVIYATARLQLHGLEGMAEGLTLISRLIQEQWEDLHPRLDPEDNSDPSRRFGYLENLSQEGATHEDDPLRFVERLRQVPLSHLPQFGTINLLSLQGAKPGSDAPSARILREAMTDARRADPTGIAKGLAAAEASQTAMQGMLKFLEETAQVSHLPALDRLTQQLQLMKEVFEMDGTPASAPQEQVASGDASPHVPPGHSEVPPATAAPAPAGIRNTADVLRSIDLICEYYKRAEPSSPVPLVLMRARRLVNQSFMDVLNDLAASAVDQVKVITGEP